MTAVTIAGCGHSGESNVTFPEEQPGTASAVTGVVRAPSGQLAATPRWWPDQWRVLSAAYALQGVLPVGEGYLVSLSLVDAIDAANGEINSPLPLVTDARTDAAGTYRIVTPEVENIDRCRLMVEVGGGTVRTRAFVISHTTDVDAVSETVVRVVLDRLTKAPPVQLCTFTPAGLTTITTAVRTATFTASGDSVAELNADAFHRALAYRGVRDAIDAATGVPVAEP